MYRQPKTPPLRGGLDQATVGQRESPQPETTETQQQIAITRVYFTDTSVEPLEHKIGFVITPRVVKKIYTIMSDLKRGKLFNYHHQGCGICIFFV